jgi:hypothetical protein
MTVKEETLSWIEISTYEGVPANLGELLVEAQAMITKKQINSD